MCADAPEIPVVVDDQTVAAFIVNLYNAWWDCAFQLRAVGRVQ